MSSPGPLGRDLFLVLFVRECGRETGHLNSSNHPLSHPSFKLHHSMPHSTSNNPRKAPQWNHTNLPVGNTCLQFRMLFWGCMTTTCILVSLAHLREYPPASSPDLTVKVLEVGSSLPSLIMTTPSPNHTATDVLPYDGAWNIVVISQPSSTETLI